MTAAPLLRSLPRSPYLGPAHVRAGDRLFVSVCGGPAMAATAALAVPCRLEPGDEVLVIGDEAELHVIGIFGERRPLFAGRRVTIRARNAALRLSAEGEVAVSARHLSLAATELLGLFASHISEQLGTLHRRVIERASLRAEELDDLAERGWLVHARSVILRVRDALAVQGRVIRAG